jgi:hypothetical protein
MGGSMSAPDGMFNEIDRLRGLLREAFDWMLDAAHHGSGTRYGTSESDHMYMGVWEEAEDLFPRVARTIGYVAPNGYPVDDDYSGEFDQSTVNPPNR